MTGEINEVAGGREHLIAALGHQDANLGQHRLARPTFDKLDLELFLQLANLHGQRRLSHGAGFGRLAEMPVARERLEIAQLTEGYHDFSISKTYRSVSQYN